MIKKKKKAQINLMLKAYSCFGYNIGNPWAMLFKVMRGC